MGYLSVTHETSKETQNQKAGVGPVAEPRGWSDHEQHAGVCRMLLSLTPYSSQ